MTPIQRAGGEPATQHVFQTTHWSVVMAARDRAAPDAKEALASFCSTYWSPLYAFIRRKGFSPHDAEDLTQEFFFNFLERDSLRRVAPAAGKFRSYLLPCLKNFLSNHRRDQRTQRRGSGAPVISLDGSAADTRYTMEATDKITPELLFDMRWACTVLDQAMAQLRREYVQRANGEMSDDLRGFLTDREGTAPRDQLATKHSISVGAIDVAIHRLRQRFGALLREQIMQTVSAPDEVDEELRYLISIVDI